MRERNYDEIVSIVLTQLEYGVRYFDLCVDQDCGEEREALSTLVRLLTPLGVNFMISSADPEVAADIVLLTNNHCIVNCFAAFDSDKLNRSLAKACADTGAYVVVFPYATGFDEVNVKHKASRLIRHYELTVDAGVSIDHVLFDPFIIPVVECPESAKKTLQVMRRVSASIPQSKFLLGANNFARQTKGQLRSILLSFMLEHFAREEMTHVLMNIRDVATCDSFSQEHGRLVKNVIQYGDTPALNRLMEHYGQGQPSHQHAATCFDVERNYAQQYLHAMTQ
jgi:cobalamin-dependent methionine synthase I